MKYSIPEISWHNRDPVLSIDFQPNCGQNDYSRIATGGTDSHVLIWYLTTSATGSVNLEVAADLTRHQKAVNVVRWSPSGEYLASGDDESIIFIWKQRTDKDPAPQSEQSDEQDKESWIIHKTLRGHMEDVLDISWSSNSLHLVSGSVDNKLLMWDVNKARYTAILTDHKGFVQGVAWDPSGQLIVSASTDRVFRAFDIATKKVVSRSSKAILPVPADHPLHNVRVRLYHDDTLQTFYRRLSFSPDGLLIAVPAGRIEPEQGKLETKPMNAVYIYTRYSLKIPACILPCGDSPALVTRWSPLCYKLRPGGPKPAFPLGDKRMILAVATKGSLLIYDTQQKTPIALISNIHYTRLTDLSWSADGRVLLTSSTDGFCSVIMFGDGELGEVLSEPPPELTSKDEPMEVEHSEAIQQETSKSDDKNNMKLDAFMKFKPPTEKSGKSIKANRDPKTPVKLDVLEETAMQSWSDNSNNEILKHKEAEAVIPLEDSEDIVLVYEDTEALNKSNNSPAEQKSVKEESPKVVESQFLRQAKVTDIKEPVVKNALPSPKAPRRVNFVTLSSPKNSKKKC